MGLPLFKEPEATSSDKVKARLDQTAATSRSAIRRESTIRPSRYNTSTSTRTERPRSARLLEEFRTRAAENVQTADRAQQRHRDADRDRERPQRNRNNHSRLWWGEQGDDGESNDSNRRWVGEELLRDALLQDRSDRHLRLPRPPRESSLRFEVAPSPAIPHSRPTSSRSFHTASRTYIPSPPYSSHDNRAARASPDGHARTVGDSPRYLTPDFAPAHGFHSANASSNSGRTSLPVEPVIVEHSSYDDDILRRLGTPPAESWESPYPPLRRVGHLSPRRHPPSYDGLGDRLRSPVSSSSGSGAEEDTWETLLTTMEPDEHLPSAESSFTSATASASTSRRSGSAFHSDRSSQTRTTSIGEDECEPVGGNAASTTDGDVEEWTRWATDGRNGRGSALSESIIPRAAAHSRQRRRPPFEHRDRLAGLRARRDTLQQVENRAAEGDTDLSNMQRFIERMARREDIPDEWWSAAGLSRIVRDNQ